VSNVFYLRPTEPPVTPDLVREMARSAGGCFDLYRVDWVASLLADDATRLLCWYRAPDAESARQALSQLGSDLNAVWPGDILGEQSDPIAQLGEIRSVAEHTLDPATGPSAEELLEAGGPLESDPDFVTAIVSRDHRRVLALYRSPMPETSNLSASRWTCAVVDPRA
jgi:hypothetical protein